MKLRPPWRQCMWHSHLHPKIRRQAALSPALSETKLASPSLHEDLVLWFLADCSCSSIPTNAISALQIKSAIERLRQLTAPANRQAPSVASNAKVHTEALVTETPEGVHLRKRIKLQPGWLYHSSPDGVDENLLILLHGYGDTPGDCTT